MSNDPARKAFYKSLYAPPDAPMAIRFAQTPEGWAWFGNLTGPHSEEIAALAERFCRELNAIHG